MNKISHEIQQHILQYLVYPQKYLETEHSKIAIKEKAQQIMCKSLSEINLQKHFNITVKMYRDFIEYASFEINERFQNDSLVLLLIFD